MPKSSLKVKDLKEKLRRVYNRLDSKKRSFGRRHFFLVGLVLGAAYLFTRHLVILLMIVAVPLISIYTSKFRINKLGLESATFFTIVSGYVFGPELGIYLGLIFITLQAFTGGPPGIYILWVIPSYGLAGYLAGSYNHMPIDTLGPALVAFFQSFFFTMTVIFSREYTAKYFQYAIFNFVVNTALFSVLAPILIEVLSQT